jgi:hypothetical protein
MLDKAKPDTESIRLVVHWKRKPANWDSTESVRSLFVRIRAFSARPLAACSTDAIRVLSRKVMALSEDLCDLYAFLDTPLLAWRRAQKRRKEWISEILSKRHTFGEFSHLRTDLQEDESQYFRPVRSCSSEKSKQIWMVRSSQIYAR